jgi:hypothetical protein
VSQGSDVRYDAALPRAQRRAQGAYYTPDAVVRYIVGQTLTGELWRGNGIPTVLDPACGDGAFLCEVAARLVEHAQAKSPRQVLKLLQQSLFGIDCDAVAIDLARRRIAQSVLGNQARPDDASTLAASLSRNLIVANALVDELPEHEHWPSSFDAVVGNPPYVNIRQLAKQDASLLAQYRARFRCARQGFDLYVLFIERALQRLRTGGRCGLIVPNKLATLGYAATCRAMLVGETQIDLIADCSTLPLFAGASVYPQIVVFEKKTPEANHTVKVTRSFHVEPIARVPQTHLNARGVFAWASHGDFESRLPTKRLDEVCRLHSGTTGFLAQQIAGELKEGKDCHDDTYPFITSGNIDRYQVQLGNVRYMKRTFAAPVLPCDCRRLTPAKRRLFSEPKIVIAGMSRRLEAAWHESPLALGVQVFAAAELRIDPYLVLAILNSRLMSYLFQTRFSAKRLGGGYFSVNKGQLAPLPMPDVPQLPHSSSQWCDELSRLARKLSRDKLADSVAQAIEGRIDQLVGQLYQARVEELAHIDETVPARRAA